LPEKEKKEIKGIKLHILNLVIVVMICILHAILLLEVGNISRKYQSLIDSTDDYIACQQDAALLIESSDYLTEQVRLYTINTDPQYLTAYFDELEIECRRDRALADLQTHHPDDEIYAALETALNYSNELTETEFYAMKLVAAATGADPGTLPQQIAAVTLDEADAALSADEMLQKAREMVFDDHYQQFKNQIEYYVSQVTEPILAETYQKQTDSAGQLRTAIVRERVCLLILLIANLVTCCIITLLVIKPLRRDIDHIRNKELLDVDGAYEFRYLAVTYNDIYTHNAATQAVLRHKAERDALTGLLNRGAFEQVTKLLTNDDTPIALLIVDVDNFKHVNDDYSHRTGDKILKKVAEILRRSFRFNDYVMRIGGDEFAVIMTGATDQLQQVIQKKVDRINGELGHPTEEDEPPVSLSIGIAFSEHGYDHTLFDQADEELYRVKDNGRCGCSFSTAEAEDDSADDRAQDA
jgi:diguanylate cyclase (GGDEF)-like protein